ncbi:ribosome biogenesis GTPase Der [Armatimonas rosea]|uniref:GTPase Der n=1 Tax=Armatimonas rosea TaxID=685828 RepID=A0A7W9SUF1_ARMRO|nr:ribosome biogenesis GTPase Der [Armatimonas rosea]MBB6052169.1 GTP-binding protein [Armatimonas rosea]
MPKPIVAIVGRPNVGKSTLFNRLTGKRIAIVEDTPGITRDRLYAEGEWNGRNYTLIDTGGISMDEDDPMQAQVRIQAEIAMEEADVILMLCDASQGITPNDIELADELRGVVDVPLFVVVNKSDNPNRDQDAMEFYSLGLGEIYPVSAISSRGVGDLLDEVVASFPPETEEDNEDETVRIALVGRPNVGKSSMVNAILGEERTIVSPVAGTTRDAIDTYFEFEGKRILLIDTAGIRRSGKIQGTVEYYSVLRAQRAIERCDVAVTVIDSIEGLRDGDKRVLGMAHEAGKASVICVNKWDEGRKGVLEENAGKNPMRILTQTLRDELPFCSYAPVAFCSALKGTGIGAFLETAIHAAENHSMRIPTGELNRLIRDAVDSRPYTTKGRNLKVKYATMAAVQPPTIVLFVNDPELMHFSYQRYLENQLRKTYGLEGTPLKIICRKAAKDREDRD